MENKISEIPSQCPCLQLPKIELPTWDFPQNIGNLENTQSQNQLVVLNMDMELHCCEDVNHYLQFISEKKSDISALKDQLVKLEQKMQDSIIPIQVAIQKIDDQLMKTSNFTNLRLLLQELNQVITSPYNYKRMGTLMLQIQKHFKQNIHHKYKFLPSVADLHKQWADNSLKIKNIILASLERYKLEHLQEINEVVQCLGEDVCDQLVKSVAHSQISSYQEKFKNSVFTVELLHERFQWLRNMLKIIQQYQTLCCLFESPILQMETIREYCDVTRKHVEVYLRTTKDDVKHILQLWALCVNFEKEMSHFILEEKNASDEKQTLEEKTIIGSIASAFLVKMPNYIQFEQDNMKKLLDTIYTKYNNNPDTSYNDLFMYIKSSLSRAVSVNLPSSSILYQICREYIGAVKLYLKHYSTLENMDSILIVNLYCSVLDTLKLFFQHYYEIIDNSYHEPIKKMETLFEEQINFDIHLKLNDLVISNCVYLQDLKILSKPSKKILTLLHFQTPTLQTYQQASEWVEKIKKMWVKTLQDCSTLCKPFLVSFCNRYVQHVVQWMEQKMSSEQMTADQAQQLLLDCYIVRDIFASTNSIKKNNEDFIIPKLFYKAIHNCFEVVLTKLQILMAEEKKFYSSFLLFQNVFHKEDGILVPSSKHDRKSLEIILQDLMKIRGFSKEQKKQILEDFKNTK